MINLKKLYCYFSGQVYIDPQLKRIKGKTLLHITDTPKSIFPALSRLIRELNPNYIVHTGDLVDNIKLGLLPGSIYRYTRDVAPLIDLLEASPAEKIFIAIGNHDNLKVVQDIAKRSTIIKNASLESIESRQFYIGHDATKLEDETPFLGASFALFGHNLETPTYISPEQAFLNGLTHIHLVELDSGIVHFLDYPYGTDDQRLRKVRIRL